MTSIRLIDLSYSDGPRQLATTEAIMSTVAKGAVPPTVRLYSWSEPVVILGVGQPASDLDLEHCRASGYRILRRIAGGTAVYHDRNEVSIDLILPTGHQIAPNDVHEGYRRFASLLSAALNPFGVDAEPVDVEAARELDQDPLLRPVCFASLSPFEFFQDGRKLNGLCQIRRRNVITYQTAIYNRFTVEPLIASIRHDTHEVRNLRASRLDSFVTDLERASGGPVNYDSLQRSLADAIEAIEAVRVVPGEMSPAEEQETERLVTEKYGNDDWTFRR